MVKCKICGREFKSKSALGGHMSTAHRGKRTGEEAQAQVLPRPVPVQEPTPSEEASEAEQIQLYLKQGYSFRLLTEKFGFKPTTVRQEMAKFIPPDQKGKTGEQEQHEAGLPIVLKDGKGGDSFPGGSLPQACGQ